MDDKPIVGETARCTTCNQIESTHGMYFSPDDGVTDATCAKCVQAMIQRENNMVFGDKLWHKINSLLVIIDGPNGTGLIYKHLRAHGNEAGCEMIQDAIKDLQVELNNAKLATRRYDREECRLPEIQ